MKPAAKISLSLPYIITALFVIVLSGNAHGQTLIDTVDNSGLTDAYNAQNLTLDSNVTTWTDLIGSKNATAASAASDVNYITSDPTVGSSSVFNGGQYVNFGSSEGVATSSALFSGTASRSIAVVFNTPGGDNNSTNPIVGEGTGTTQRTWFMLQARSSPAGDPYLAGFADDDSGTSAAPVANQLVFSIATYDSGTGDMTVYWADGISGSVQSLTKAASPALDTLATPFTFGFDAGNEQPSGDMQIGQTLVYDNAMSSSQAKTEIQDLQAYYAEGAPEPATWTLIMSGAGLVFLVARRRIIS